MGVVNDLCKCVPIPKMALVEQFFDEAYIDDVEKAVADTLEDEKVLDSIKPGMSVAITAGSRGICNIDTILRTIVNAVKSREAVPFIIPAMGSHGGATAEGQVQVLKGLGITQETMDCEIKSSMTVERIGTTEDNRPIQIDAYAAKADGIIVVNRVKAHTSFTGHCESGLMKMMAIGLAKQAGAEVCHQEGYAKIADNILKYGHGILNNSKVLFGVAILENAFDKTSLVKAVKPEDFEKAETSFLTKAKSMMPKIYFSDIDVLVVDKIGKNISGLGMDPHVSGCFASPYAHGPNRPEKTVVLDLTDETHGNGNGIGVADVTTRRLYEKFDMEATYPNALTATLTSAVRIPMVMEDQKLAIQAAIKTAPGFEKENIRMVRIKDTLSLGQIWISESMITEAETNPNVKIIRYPEEMTFDENGNLF
ncbi:MAG: lactate racemase domain-containing protein [Eubacteriales bacterium]|nr:lactate racemase domain-containing protein [Eubacteriales bacterium]